MDEKVSETSPKKLKTKVAKKMPGGEGSHNNLRKKRLVIWMEVKAVGSQPLGVQTPDKMIRHSAMHQKGGKHRKVVRVVGKS